MTSAVRFPALLAALSCVGLATAGPIYNNTARLPSNVKTIFPQSPLTKAVQDFTSIACYNAMNGELVNCAYNFRITGLSQPNTDAANNGGHSHGFASHPVGKLQMVVPVPGGETLAVSGQTMNDIVVVTHKIPEVSGRIETVLDLVVPPGWHTVYPESLDDTRTSWRWITTVDVGLRGLTSLPDGSMSYYKSRSPDTAHTDAVAYFGTSDAVLYLGAIADTYLLLRNRPVSINDMSLPAGGLFDVNANYASPHSLHRAGASVDINKTDGDCLKNKNLLKAVDMLMPIIRGSVFQKRIPPSRFLCETFNKNNIHIDLDVQEPGSPSPY